MIQAKNGEIATLLTLGTLLIIGFSTFASSYLLKNKQTTISKADPATVTPVPTWPQCQCKDGAPSGPECEDVNPCSGAPPSGTPSDNCSYGAWKTECAGTNQGCPADAGVENAWWCNNSGNWVYQNPGCSVRCKTENIAGATLTPSAAVCTSAGMTLNECEREDCDGSLGDFGEIICVTKYCDADRKIQYKPGRRTGKSCQTVTCRPGQLYRSCDHQTCNATTKKYSCVDIYWSNDCKPVEKVGITTAASCDPSKPEQKNIRVTPKIDWKYIVPDQALKACLNECHRTDTECLKECQKDFAEKSGAVQIIKPTDMQKAGLLGGLCGTGNVCEGDLVCTAGRCVRPTPRPTLTQTQEGVRAQLQFTIYPSAFVEPSRITDKSYSGQICELNISVEPPTRSNCQVVSITGTDDKAKINAFFTAYKNKNQIFCIKNGPKEACVPVNKMTVTLPK